jgi:GH35 family endo-1,4-beta-xylanase
MASEAPATDTSKDKGTTTTTTTMEKMEKKTTVKPAKSEKAVGELTAVDDAGKKGTLKTKAGKEWSFTWDDKTVVTPKDAKLEVGGHVTVWHAKDSDLATKIAVAKAKMAKAEKKS